MDLIGFGMVLPILPIYARRFHATSLQAALLVTAFSAAGFVGAPLWGRLSDRWGRRPVILVSLAGTAAGSLITGLAGGLPLLYVGRLVDGASGASVAVAQAAAADLAGPPGAESAAARSRLFGLLGAAFGVGFVAGPAIGALAALAGPRTPFLVAAGLAAANTVAAWFRLPETRRPATGSPAPGQEGDPRAAKRSVAPLIGVAFAVMTAFSAFEATFSLFGQKHLGLGIGSAAAVFTGVGVVVVGVQGGAVPAVARRLGEVRTLQFGLALVAGGLAVLAPARSWASAAPALLLLTAGQGLVQTTMTATLAGRAGPEQRGRLLGAQQSASALARIVGPALGGAALGGAASGLVYAVGAALSGAALVGVVVFAAGDPDISR